jgi:hypothetical protein
MKTTNYLKHGALSFFACFVVNLSFAQCIQTTPYGTLTASGSTYTPQTIETCNYGGEYATVTLPGAGTWTFESNVGTDYLTISNTANTVLQTGTTPVTYTSAGAITIRLHISINAGCDPQSSCRVTTVTKAPCLASFAYGSLTASSATLDPQEIDGCNYAGDYASISLPGTGDWTFSSSVSSDFLFLTNTANEILATGTSPITYTASGAANVRLHIFTDNECGTQSACRTTYVQKAPCLSSTQYPSSMVNASATYNSSTSITTCNYAGEFAVVYLPGGGNWTFNSSNASDFMVITNTDNEVLTSGQVSVTYTASDTDTVHMHIFADANCGTQSSCRATTVTREPCFASTKFPALTQTADTLPVTQTITTCNHAGEYFEIVLNAPNQYLIESSNPDDIFYFTDPSNNFYFSAQTPVTANVTGIGTLVLRAHLFASAGCETESVCRETTVKCLTCVTPQPELVVVDSIICGNDGPISLSANDTIDGHSTYWYSGSCGGTPIDSGSQTAVNPPSSGWYYVANDVEGTRSLCDSVFINVFDNPTLTTTMQSGPSCFGDTNGAITVATTGGGSVYSYSWSTGSASNSISNLSAGAYTVTVTDENTCFDVSTVTLVDPAELSATLLQAIDVDCFGESNGSATGSASGGSGLLSYMWSNGSISTSATTLPPGPHYFSVLDDSNCTDTVEFTLSEPAEIIASTVINDDPKCFGDSTGTIEVEANGGIGNFDYTWSNGSSSASAMNIAAGVHTVTISDDSNCTITYLDSLQQPDIISAITINKEDPGCFGDSTGMIEIQAMGGTGNLVFDWSNGNSTSQASNITAGVHSVTISDDSNCSVTYVDSLEQPDALSMSLDAVNATCESDDDGEVSSNVSGGTTPYNYSWNEGSTSDVLSGLMAGTYTLLTTDSNGCTIEDSAVVEFDFNDPIISMPDSSIICDGFNASLDAGNPGSSFAWSTGDDTQVIVIESAGTYTVTVTSIDGCSSQSSSIVEEESCLGISKSPKPVSIKVYPNPTNGLISIEAEGLDSEGKITVTDLHGKVVSETKTVFSNGQQTQLNLEGVAKGVYFLQIKTQTDSYGQRIVIQ